ncbi:tetraspanin Tsp3 [Calycina marina]|uniref:Tetraspanin Tsp3 n=1 Tax=Calycina marina TaxID=1763456 RepID=A0A9P7YY09_9HELO|nr:tetraspanin Tsp3 [Calycina marina]
MASISKVMPWLIPLLLIALTGVAGYAYSQIRYLSLPIPAALGLFTVILPLITGVSAQGANTIIKRAAKEEQYQLTIPLIAILGFQLIYETVVATLALTYILPPSSLNCGLGDGWQQMWVSRNEKAVKDIQNAFECCGLWTVKDRAWPFSRNAASTCAETFGRTRSCAGDWRKAEQMTAGLFLLVAAVVFCINVLTLISLLTSSSRWAGWPTRLDDESASDTRRSTRRFIEAGDAEESYQDEPDASANQDRGPIVAPSLLQNDSDNAWQT